MRKYFFLIFISFLVGSSENTESLTNTEWVPVVCTSTVNTFPYIESFESGTGAWLNTAIGDALDWTRDCCGTPSSNTGPGSAWDGSWYMYIEASSPNFPNFTANLNGPCIDLSNEGEANFAFKYHMYGAAMGNLNFDVSSDGLVWTTIWTNSGNQNNFWIQGNINLTPYAGSIIYTRFSGTTGSSWSSDIAIDDIVLTTGASVDTDGDGIYDTVDIDDDNDGILDDEECEPIIFNTMNVGYFPDSRRHPTDSDFGYTIDGSHFFNYGRRKMINTTNFGTYGTVSYAINLVPITQNPVTEADLNSLNLNVIFVGDFTYGSGIIGQPTTIATSELNALVSWSTASSTNLVIVSQREAELGWGYTLSSGSSNPITPTLAGNATTIFDGAFGAVTSFNQGGSFQARMSGGDGIVLATETGGGSVILLDNPTGDIILSDVDILSNLGGVSFGDNIDLSNGNDIIFGNVWGYIISLVTDPDVDGDGNTDCTDLDADNDGIWDASEAGHGLTVGADGRILGSAIGSGANGLFDLVEFPVESGTLNYSYSDSETVPDGIYDFDEIDADGDGCFDTQEAGVSDSEPDGTAGTGIPTVDANGLVASITYSAPPNNNWQNPANQVACSVSATCEPSTNPHLRSRITN